MSGSGDIPPASADEIGERAIDHETVKRRARSRIFSAGQGAAVAPAGPPKEWHEDIEYRIMDLLDDIDPHNFFSMEERIDIFQRGVAHQQDLSGDGAGGDE